MCGAPARPAELVQAAAAGVSAALALPNKLRERAGGAAAGGGGGGGLEAGGGWGGRATAAANGRAGLREVPPPLPACDQSRAPEARPRGGWVGGARECVAAAAASVSRRPRPLQPVGGAERAGKGRAARLTGLFRQWERRTRCWAGRGRCGRVTDSPPRPVSAQRRARRGPMAGGGGRGAG